MVGFYVSALVVAIAICVGWGEHRYSAGQASRNGEIATYQAAIKASEELARQAEAKAASVSAQVVIEYRDRVKVIKEKEPGEIQLVEIIKREVDPNCSMPPSYRQLWDGTGPPGGAAGENPQGVDAAPVPLADLAEPTRQAREAYKLIAARLIAWQGLATKNGWQIQ